MNCGDYKKMYTILMLVTCLLRVQRIVFGSWRRGWQQEGYWQNKVV